MRRSYARAYEILTGKSTNNFWYTSQTSKSYASRSETKPVDKISTLLCSTADHKTQETQRNFIQTNAYYDIQVVRPEGESCGIDPYMLINGQSRVVSTLRVYVYRVEYYNHRIDLYCRGTDRYGKPVDGIYSFYQTPDTRGIRDTYIYSITRKDGYR